MTSTNTNQRDTVEANRPGGAQHRAAVIGEHTRAVQEIRPDRGHIPQHAAKK